MTLEQQKQHEHLFRKAYDSLRQEFTAAVMHGPDALAPSPRNHTGLDERPVRLLAQEMLADEGGEILAGHLLSFVATRCRAGDARAVELLDLMAGEHAARHTDLMNDAGDFNA